MARAFARVVDGSIRARKSHVQKFAICVRGSNRPPAPDRRSGAISSRTRQRDCLCDLCVLCVLCDLRDTALQRTPAKHGRVTIITR